MAGSGVFREDLFYRLNVVRVRLPPLRERREEIDHLCHHFVKKFNKSLNVRVTGFSAAACQMLLRYDWPGNVRELENVVQRGMVMAEGVLIETEHLPAAVRNLRGADKGAANPEKDNNLYSLKKAQKALEKKLIAKALAEGSGNKSRAAQLLEISYPSLLSKIKEYGL